jgi:hypothetical protein
VAPVDRIDVEAGIDELAQERPVFLQIEDGVPSNQSICD